MVPCCTRGNDGVLRCTSLRRFTLPSRKLDMKAGNESTSRVCLLLMLNASNQCQSSTRRSSDDGRAHVHLLGVRVLLPGSRNSCINKAHFVVTLRLASHSIALHRIASLVPCLLNCPCQIMCERKRELEAQHVRGEFDRGVEFLEFFFWQI